MISIMGRSPCLQSHLRDVPGRFNLTDQADCNTQLADAVGVAGQICEDSLGFCEGMFAVDDPLNLAQWCQPATGSAGICRAN
jgi:hypothetical protein